DVFDLNAIIRPVNMGGAAEIAGAVPLDHDNVLAVTEYLAADADVGTDPQGAALFGIDGFEAVAVDPANAGSRCRSHAAERPTFTNRLAIKRGQTQGAVRPVYIEKSAPVP